MADHDLESLKNALGDELKDLRLNLGSVLTSGNLDETQRYAVALSAALFLRAQPLAEAIAAEGKAHLDEATITDIRAAAGLMAMNTVYYRFRHMIGKDSYQQRPAGLRMSRMARPATTKALFELCSTGCAALAGCEVCIRSHEESLRKEGLSEDQVHDAVRIAAVVQGFLVATVAAGLAVPATA